jgi:hypothetical protein
MWKILVEAGQATADNMIWHMHFACWVAKTLNALLKYLYLLPFNGNIAQAKALNVTLYVHYLSFSM